MIQTIEVAETLRILIGTLFLLFLPGFIWGFVFFDRDGLTWSERIALSFGMSVALTTLSILFLNRYLGVRINAANSFFAISLIVILPMVYIWKSRGLSSRNLSVDLVKKRPSRKIVYLLLILLLAAYLNYIPHAGYDYPVHRDEWVHLTWGKAIFDANISFI